VIHPITKAAAVETNIRKYGIEHIMSVITVCVRSLSSPVIYTQNFSVPVIRSMLRITEKTADKTLY
ncbi:MAG: hypothetical protein J6P89_06150, partial [Oscillospiraceae bacterium]|nr:hypothetical protein [Oscillospiraceae bacterium]